ncbi:hypothetical protein PZ895_12540 [Mesorhizobium sp. YIM 152430]|uniref:hypothetical protein n=1 Tax=Mesorhizobium sp. YIM 152430 TaxID=3031761 RepID=UPI0023DAF780|nr:hypothetical protein [Mesorhizobium sp. YIM 152430]MDF1600589.1 hypothetical protein [Mesorhizobium sp. YIM 152430]
MLAARLAPPLALIGFVAFFAVILWKVPRLDLAIVIGLGIVAVLYDLFETARRGTRSRRTRALD